MKSARATIGLLSVLALTACHRANGQITIPPGPPIYSPPGYYGTLYGTPTFGSVQAFSRFPSSFGGPGYGLGYGPSSILPGPSGQGLWSPAAPALGYSYSSGPYRTFRAVPVPEYPAYLPPFGYYAPALGPPYFIE